MNRILATVALSALVIIGVAPLEAGSGNRCSPAGTWYGGSADGPKYLLTITPRGGNSFTFLAQGAYSLSSAGVVANTSYSGELVKVGPGRYLGRLITLLAYDDAIPPTMMEIDAASGITEMTTCNELMNTIDYFVAYLGWGATPFVDEPDFDLLEILAGGEPIVETYERISMAPMD